MSELSLQGWGIPGFAWELGHIQALPLRHSKRASEGTQEFCSSNLSPATISEGRPVDVARELLPRASEAINRSLLRRRMRSPRAAHVSMAAFCFKPARVQVCSITIDYKPAAGRVIRPSNSQKVCPGAEARAMGTPRSNIAWSTTGLI